MAASPLLAFFTTSHHLAARLCAGGTPRARFPTFDAKVVGIASQETVFTAVPDLSSPVHLGCGRSPAARSEGVRGYG
jgi:hypothetical protein